MQIHFPMSKLPDNKIQAHLMALARARSAEKALRLGQGGADSWLLGRSGLNRNLVFSDSHRIEHPRRANDVVRLFAQSGAVVITALITSLQAHFKRFRIMRGIWNATSPGITIDTAILFSVRRIKSKWPLAAVNLSPSDGIRPGVTSSVVLPRMSPTVCVPDGT